MGSTQGGQFPGDRVELFVRPPTVPVFGSTTKVSQVSFSANELSMAEPLARIGGPDERTANAPGKLATILGQLFSPILAVRAVTQ